MLKEKSKPFGYFERCDVCDTRSMDNNNKRICLKRNDNNKSLLFRRRAEILDVRQSTFLSTWSLQHNILYRVI